jgi:hypothetical protein
METLKANELRIGNWISNPHTKKDSQATIENISDIQNGFMQRVGIPLTEEWLLKFGGYYEDGCCLITVGKIVIRTHLPNMKQTAFYAYVDSLLIKRIETVHEAQNFVFALTGNELTIKTQ